MLHILSRFVNFLLVCISRSREKIRNYQLYDRWRRNRKKETCRERDGIRGIRVVINSQTFIAAVYDICSRRCVKFILIQCDVPVERDIDKNYAVIDVPSLNRYSKYNFIYFPN